MAIGKLPFLVQQLSHWKKRGEGIADAELLQRYVEHRDETAFELLAWRHGGLVLGVCRRILRDDGLAEDAFQATLLTLVRKAKSIRCGATLSGWLHTVAFRTALHAKAQIERDALRTASAVPDRPESDTPETLASNKEIYSLLDDEIERLPEIYRIPFLLCYLEGKTNEEAARDLNCPIGTIMSRLGRAREKLRKRLSRRGVALAAAVAGGALSTQALAAPVSETLLAHAAQSAQQLSSGALTPAAAPWRWSDSMARGMTEFPLRGILVGMATVALLAVVTFFGADFLLTPADKYSISANKPETGPKNLLCQANGPALALDGLRLALLDTLDTRELPTQAMVLSSDGKTLATGDREGNVLFWETWSRQMLAQLPVGAPVTCLHFSQNAQTLLVGCQDGSLQLWDCKQRKKLWHIQAHQDAVLSLAACPGRNHAVSSSADDEVRLWRYTDGEATGAVTGAGEFPRLAFSPDDTHLFAAGARGKILAWDVDTWRHNGLWADLEQRVAQLVFSRDGRMMATVGSNGDIHIWDRHTRALKQRLKCDDAASFAAFSADGSILATGGPRHSIRTFDISSGKPLGYLQGHADAVAGAAFHPKYALLFSAAADGTWRVWDYAAASPEWVESGEEKALTAVGKYGGVVRDRKQPHHPIVSLMLAGAPVTDDDVRQFDGLEKLESLNLQKTSITDVALRHLRPHKQLKSLSLAETSVSDEGLKQLRQLTALESLDLRKTRVTDAGLCLLKENVQLKSLNLAGTAIGGAGLEEVAHLKQLQYLDLLACRLTEAAQKHLSRLAQLRFLNLAYCEGIDANWVADLQRALPRCRIVWATLEKENVRSSDL
ncbi:MAG: sigma-70 family RNA polymerase sigma factor [Gemmataceae bacterium]|nr:sigma-70 family RNA polymerase sigma factor [Gemmataceae bacterium]MCI0738839.1 sigma-70 family RNA polymerase sigma factor [Gemmataceae bacterium]